VFESSDTLDYHSPRQTRWWTWWRWLRLLAVCLRLSLRFLSSVLGLLLISVATFIAVTPQSREIWQGLRVSFTPRGACVWRLAYLTLNDHSLNVRVISYRGETLDGTPTLRNTDPHANIPRYLRRWLNLSVPPPKFDRWGVRYEHYFSHQDVYFYETLTKVNVQPRAIFATGLIFLLPPTAMILLRRRRRARRLTVAA
jgi:hypothetical protein